MMEQYNLNANEENIMKKLVKKANKKREIVLLQPWDIGYSGNLTEGKHRFKRMLDNLEKKGCLTELSFQDKDKCIVDYLVIDEELYKVIIEVLKDEQTNK